MGRIASDILFWITVVPLFFAFVVVWFFIGILSWGDSMDDCYYEHEDY